MRPSASDVLYLLLFQLTDNSGCSFTSLNLKREKDRNKLYTLMDIIQMMSRNLFYYQAVKQTSKLRFP